MLFNYIVFGLSLLLVRGVSRNWRKGCNLSYTSLSTSFSHFLPIFALSCPRFPFLSFPPLQPLNPPMWYRERCRLSALVQLKANIVEMSLRNSGLLICNNMNVRYLEKDWNYKQYRPTHPGLYACWRVIENSGTTTSPHRHDTQCAMNKIRECAGSNNNSNRNPNRIPTYPRNLYRILHVFFFKFWVVR